MATMLNGAAVMDAALLLVAGNEVRSQHTLFASEQAQNRLDVSAHGATVVFLLSATGLPPAADERAFGRR